MNIRPALWSSLVFVAGVAAAAPASALTCYSVLDRNDNTIYRDTYPPVDLSDQGAAERERMRRRGEHLIAMESDRCPTLQFFLGNAGTANLNVDQVIAGMPVRSTISAPGVGAGSAMGGTGASGGRTGTRPAAAPAASSTAKSTGGGTRRY